LKRVNLKNLAKYVKLTYKKEAPLITKVTMSRNFEKQLEKIPPRVVTKVKYWIFTVRLAGLAEVRRRPGLHDEPLKGKRQGHARSGSIGVIG
jgi:hypothetical protein